MATNKHASIRYRVLDSCFKDTKKKYFIDDLIKACSSALAVQTEYNTVSRRQIFDDINFMKSEDGWNIELDENCKIGKKKYYRYVNTEFSIANQGLNKDEVEQIKETLLMLERFKTLPSYGWVEELMVNLEGRFNLNGNSSNLIGFEQNKELKGLNFLSDLIDATMKEQVLDIDYVSRKHENIWTIHPYYVKQYNNRWYLLGLNEERGDETLVALDRIKDLKKNKSIPFKKNTLFDAEHYFDDVIGVTIPKDIVGNRKHKEEVLLKFSEKRFPMVESKPLHPSQRKVLGEPYTISINIIPNQELEQCIFSFGTDVEVIAPQWMRKDFSRKFEELVKKYLPVQNDRTDT